MSSMNYLKRLLDGVEVEWKTLGEVTNVLRGRRLTKSQLTEGAKFPVYHGGLEPLGHYVDSNRPANTTMIINVGASAGTVGYSFVDFWSSDGCFCLEHNELLNNRFLYFSLIGHQSFLRSRVRVAGIPTLDVIVVEKLEIPIPCPDNPQKSLEIQGEIVRILDAFTELTAELTAELIARKRQYNHYRDQLLKFEEGEAEWKSLEEVFDILAGGDAPKNALSGSETEEFSIPILSNGIGEKSLYGWTDKAKIDKPSLTISARGTIGWTSYRDKPFFPIVRLLVLTPKVKLNLKYAYYFMKTIENDYNIPEAGIPQLTKPMLKDIKIPLPCPGNPEKSLAEQGRIAAALDKFDTLANSITEGLPREIELRQKQYEHYRDLLLSFPKPEAVEA